MAIAERLHLTDHLQSRNAAHSQEVSHVPPARPLCRSCSAGAHSDRLPGPRPIPAGQGHPQTGSGFEERLPGSQIFIDYEDLKKLHLPATWHEREVEQQSQESIAPALPNPKIASFSVRHQLHGNQRMTDNAPPPGRSPRWWRVAGLMAVGVGVAALFVAAPRIFLSDRRPPRIPPRNFRSSRSPPARSATPGRTPITWGAIRVPRATRIGMIPSAAPAWASRSASWIPPRTARHGIRAPRRSGNTRWPVRYGQSWHKEFLLGSGKDTLLTEYPVKYVVGSGEHARTYLVEAEGFLVESPVTW